MRERPGGFDRPFDARPGLGRGLLLRIPPHGRTGRCHGLARGAPQTVESADIRCRKDFARLLLRLGVSWADGFFINHIDIHFLVGCDESILVLMPAVVRRL